MNVLKKVFNNARKPQGVIGKIMVTGMNGNAHAMLAKWALYNLVSTTTVVSSTSAAEVEATLQGCCNSVPTDMLPVSTIHQYRLRNPSK